MKKQNKKYNNYNKDDKSRRAAAGRAQLLAKRESILGACMDFENLRRFFAFAARPPAVGCYTKARPPAVGCYRGAAAAFCIVWHGRPLSAVTRRHGRPLSAVTLEAPHKRESKEYLAHPSNAENLDRFQRGKTRNTSRTSSMLTILIAFQTGKASDHIS